MGKEVYVRRDGWQRAKLVSQHQVRSNKKQQGAKGFARGESEEDVKSGWTPMYTCIRRKVWCRDRLDGYLMIFVKYVYMILILLCIV